MKSYATKTLMILLALVALGLLAVGLYGVYFINNKSIKTAGTVALVEEGNKNSILVQSINSSNDNSNNELVQLNELALPQEGLVGFIETLESLAEEMGLNIKIISVNIEEGKSTDNPDKVHFNIETNGGWSRSMQFLHAIEFLPYRTMISNTSISTGVSGAASTSTQSWKLATDLAVYSFK